MQVQGFFRVYDDLLQRNMERGVYIYIYIYIAGFVRFETWICAYVDAVLSQAKKSHTDVKLWFCIQCFLDHAIHKCIVHADLN